MRLLPIISAILLFVTAGCGSSTPKVIGPIPTLPTSSTFSLPPENPFIPGKYTTVEEANFYTVWDTIVIVQGPHQQKRFRILRHTAFQRNSPDKDAALEHERLEWLGLYDDVSQTLNGINKNIDLHCMPAKQQISLWGIVYTRIE